MRFPRGLCVERQQARQRNINAVNFVKVERIAKTTNALEFRFREGVPERRRQFCPAFARDFVKRGERGLTVGHRLNDTPSRALV
ncbi:MAG: hypothetical protein RLZZ40_220 [Actinomycetota bacterium]